MNTAENANAVPKMDGELWVLFADPHLATAQSMSHFLSSNGNFRTKGVDTLEAAIEANCLERFDFLLYDNGLQGCLGLENLELILSAFPETTVVLFGICTDLEFLTEALKLGLKGYIPKSIALNSLIPTLDFLKAGEVFVPSEIWQKMLRTQYPVSGREGLLDCKEQQLLKFVQEGLRNKQIGDRTGETENAVKMRLRLVYRKLGVNSRIQAIRIAQELGEIRTYG